MHFLQVQTVLLTANSSICFCVATNISQTHLSNKIWQKREWFHIYQGPSKCKGDVFMLLLILQLTDYPAHNVATE